MSTARTGAGEDAHAAYVPIAEHGLIGDLRTAALVAADGRIDWFCAPRFDSPSVFGSLLDADRGGCWRMDPVCGVASRQQFYFPDTNILITRMLTEDGIVEVQDFMPVLRRHDPGHRQRLVRRVSAVRGTMTMRSLIAPRLNYGRDRHVRELHGYTAEFSSGALTVRVRGSVPLTAREGDGADAVAEFSLRAGESALFVLETCEPGADCPREPLRPERAEELFRATVAFWRDWLGQSRYTGRWREMVHRSALTLKLLTHEPTGAVIAAPTLGLPEEIGGGRNWDYRYVWIRDAAFSLYALLRLGFTEEAEAFVEWLVRCLRRGGDGEPGPLRVLYSIDGHADLPEEELTHLEGYRGSAPVRVGNRAAGQLQLDIYGELVDSIYLFNKYGKGISWETWSDLCAALDWLLDNWDGADESIWETRAGRRRHTYSRVMCWVAVERMIRMAHQRGLPADLPRWTAVRDLLYRQVMAEGWHEELGSFVQRLGGEGSPPPGILDASLLVMPMVKFLSPKDPRFLSTLDAIGAGLVADSLVFRYDASESADGLDGTEGTFSICSFWWVEALTRTGRVEEARLALEKMFTYANHLGQYAEQIGVTGEQLGNFPQAFTHLALISAAVNLDRAMG
ncbi:glycoside hydrolase family 15 protein [Streptomyces physcomitrii]|uniref:Glycoside hydrolase family 15 protein n=1 Tax=Streptomyces physcomitrii TaxID=2724184 RepID=A0ABX1H1P9_9ACTN|nr:glycoside hydrolase family 15 protein [Streptomyces physcomitrii]NKI41977.1 glycoside hydrolase family 15 protein [Streptomyces physcomitrii]